jgi:glycosyltransferase involved in cell wall biosynthesis
MSEPASPAGEMGRVWIAWETQRRSLNLAGRVGAHLLLCLDEDRGLKGILRYPRSALRTLGELWRRRGGTVFVQNPSMVLAALACAFRGILGYFLVVDRHSNFSFLAPGRPSLKRRISDWLSGYTLRNADVTIVTNAELAARVEAEGGRPFVLPDPFPEIPGGRSEPGDGDWSASLPARPLEVLFVSSWAFDEPIEAAIEACRRLQGRILMRITGRPKPAYADLLKTAPDNFVCTGFLPDEDYFALMSQSDAVMAVTTRAMTLVCGAYEAVALGKPMVLGDSPALRDYFHLGAVYTNCAVDDLEAKLSALASDLPRYRGEVHRLRGLRGAEWDRRLLELESRLPGAAHPLSN